MDKTVHKICKMRMSKQSMSDVMYAIVMTRAVIKSSFGIGIYQYNRSQNAYNNVDLMIVIDPYKIPLFEEITRLTLKEPPTPRLNNSIN